MTTPRRFPSESEIPSTSSPWEEKTTETDVGAGEADSSEGESSWEKAATDLDTALGDLAWLEEEDFEGPGMWVFGYGSLCWHPGFDFSKSLIGFVRGFSRKFWQGNTTHRGTEEKPGRVATLIEEDQGMVWGRAFQLKEKEGFSYLKNRECKLGGYLTTISTFYPRQEHKGEKSLKSFPVILYIATPSNRHWLGDSSLMEIANQVIESTGNSGHNVEYLLRLASFVRENIPEAVDDHLFNLEQLVLSQIEERNLCLKTLMGDKGVVKSEGSLRGAEGDPEEAAGAADQEAPGGGRPGRTDSFQFTSRVTSKKLRCVNIC